MGSEFLPIDPAATACLLQAVVAFLGSHTAGVVVKRLCEVNTGCGIIILAMVKESHIIIGLRDITGISIQCRNPECLSTVIHNLRAKGLVKKCPACGHQWQGGNNGEDPFDDLAAALHNLRFASPSGFDFRLVLSDEADTPQ